MILSVLNFHWRPDISINPVTESSPEAPPIPCHVHAGEVVEGHCVGLGKIEAYFFPPLDVPPYNLSLENITTRLGFKSDITKEQVN